MRRGEYADFMKTMRAAHLDLLAQNPWPGIVGTTLLPAPVYIVPGATLNGFNDAW